MKKIKGNLLQQEWNPDKFVRLVERALKGDPYVPITWRGKTPIPPSVYLISIPNILKHYDKNKHKLSQQQELIDYKVIQPKAKCGWCGRALTDSECPCKELRERFQLSIKRIK